MEPLRIIYHVPYPLVFDNPGGSGVRPVKMLRAFEQLGEVWIVAGHSAERRQTMKKVELAIADGVHFDLVYSESHTMPTTLTDPDHLPRHPLLDFGFLHRMRRHGIKVGLFYRDIYWRFPIYGKGLHPAKKQLALSMYRYDLLAYGRTVDRLYLPSLRMASHVPLPARVPLAELPPGHDIANAPAEVSPSPLRLLFIGGFSEHYRLHELFAAVKELPQVSLTICTRENEWAAARPEYEEHLADNIQVVHRHGEGLKELFANANVCVVTTKPSQYWTFAAPLKVYEYIGNGKPILASNGSLAGDFVDSQQIGWSVDYGRENFIELLRTLAERPDEVSAARKRVLQVREEHSWRRRAEQVVTDLTGKSPGMWPVPTTTTR
ncbi:glycosyltransferase [Luteococcus japonicus]|uniref:Glycosyl transferase family 1 domain-containing protein n=1 Tax=Luteococcus japonicus LSP_Lj1 TaxID=1255658 RepID=A0A1R4IKW2_9ACTN|nr:glycosyltransferase [Luteococcus japonicus]SJN20421.1 hypothetical protein FM114_02350 [Luteococcus japonicus LSP_Lj1]